MSFGLPVHSSGATRIICLIPARKGSKGVSRKNLRRVGLMTLVGRAIKVARGLNFPTHVILSSDDESILAKYSNKVDTCIKRRPDLSADNSLISDVILDSLLHLPNLSDSDILVLLEPSSPNRTVEDINAAISLMIENKYDSLITVSVLEAKYHPYKVLKPNYEGLLIEPFISNAPKISNRQEIQNFALVKNGVAYIYKVGIARTSKSGLPVSSHFSITQRPVANIDSELDLWLSRYLHLRDLINSLKVDKWRRKLDS